jgi:hypothetical protein
MISNHYTKAILSFCRDLAGEPLSAMFEKNTVLPRLKSPQVPCFVNNAFIRKSTTYYTLNSVEGSPYTLSSDGRTVEDHASIELLPCDRECRSTALWPANPITVACDFATDDYFARSVRPASEAFHNQGAELVIDWCRVDGIELRGFPDFCCLPFSSRRVVLLAGVPEVNIRCWMDH